MDIRTQKRITSLPPALPKWLRIEDGWPSRKSIKAYVRGDELAMDFVFVFAAARYCSLPQTEIEFVLASTSENYRQAIINNGVDAGLSYLTSIFEIANRRLKNV